MNHETVGYVLVAVIIPAAVVSKGLLIWHERGTTAILGLISARFWAASCAWHACRVEYRKVLRTMVQSIEAQEKERRVELAQA